MNIIEVIGSITSDPRVEKTNDAAIIFLFVAPLSCESSGNKDFLKLMNK
ncbi:hypothetical protein ACFL2V_21085 [Pseudomonadota bacterium]